jgi:hypothetical protein
VRGGAGIVSAEKGKDGPVAGRNWSTLAAKSVTRSLLNVKS